MITNSQRIQVAFLICSLPIQHYIIICSLVPVMQRYSWNNPKVGFKHQWTNQLCSSYPWPYLVYWNKYFAINFNGKESCNISLYLHAICILLSSFPPAISTCWLHKQNSYQSSREMNWTYQQWAGVITKFSQHLNDNSCEDDKSK